LLVAGLVVAPTGHAIATAPSGSGARSEGTLEDGKLLYRKYCGQCHALKVARAVGFGTVSHPFGKEGGPSFNNLRVPYSLSVLLLTQKSTGHEVLFHKLTW
jgi:hypothetical protein